VPTKWFSAENALAQRVSLPALAMFANPSHLALGMRVTPPYLFVRTHCFLHVRLAVLVVVTAQKLVAPQPGIVPVDTVAIPTLLVACANVLPQGKAKLVQVTQNARGLKPLFVALLYSIRAWCKGAQRQQWDLVSQATCVAT